VVEVCCVVCSCNAGLSRESAHDIIFQSDQERPGIRR
jgi:hypothetical protein